jgi:hypothetical protein
VSLIGYTVVVPRIYHRVSSCYNLYTEWAKVRVELSGGGTPPPQPGSGTGLSAEYYDAIDFTGAVVRRIDPTVNFDWQSDAPVAGMGADTFSVRWQGQVQPLYTETINFHVTTDDGVRLWVNNQLLVDQWVPQAATEHMGSISLQAGTRYNLRLEYFEDGGAAVAKLAWSSARQGKQIIPPTQLYPSAITGPAKYVSDLPMVSSTHGWGPVEKDRSNGESGAADGQTLTLNGITYAKGLGAHADSDVRYSVPAGCTRFRAQIGVDDEVGNAGSVVFQVYADRH